MCQEWEKVLRRAKPKSAEGRNSDLKKNSQRSRPTTREVIKRVKNRNNGNNQFEKWHLLASNQEEGFQNLGEKNEYGPDKAAFLRDLLNARVDKERLNSMDGFSRGETSEEFSKVDRHKFKAQSFETKEANGEHAIKISNISSPRTKLQQWENGRGLAEGKETVQPSLSRRKKRKVLSERTVSTTE